MKHVNVLAILSTAALSLAMVLVSPMSAVAQSSGGGNSNIGPGNVQVSGAGGFSENTLGGSDADVQGGSYASGTPIPISFWVYGVQGGGYCPSPTSGPINYGGSSYCNNYVLASCTGGSTDGGNQSSIYYSKSFSNIQASFSWTPPGPGNYFIQCEAQYVPGSSQGGGAGYGVASTGRILFSVHQ